MRPRRRRGRRRHRRRLGRWRRGRRSGWRQRGRYRRWHSRRQRRRHCWRAAGGPPDGSYTGLTPLTELTAQHQGRAGLLYPGSNAPPPAHALAGLTRAQTVEPLDRFGQRSDAGVVVLMSIGMSNTTQEWCNAVSSADGGPRCNAYSFTGQALADPAVRHATLRIVNGAQGLQVASSWDQPTDPNYDRVRDQRLAPLGFTEAQVQVLWIKVANPTPQMSLPSANADAVTLERAIGNIVRTCRLRYPNLKLAFLSSRIYGGWATTPLNPEPYAYEGGFAVKAAIEAQITQALDGGIDAVAGDLSAAVAPWVAWGPYLWADGLRPRADGLIWERADLDPLDGTHPSQAGQRKVGAQLLQFFKTSPFSRCWFTSTDAGCP